MRLMVTIGLPFRLPTDNSKLLHEQHRSNGFTNTALSIAPFVAPHLDSTGGSEGDNREEVVMTLAHLYYSWISWRSDTLTALARNSNDPTTTVLVVNAVLVFSWSHNNNENTEDCE